MHDIRLFIKLTLYYAGMGCVIWILSFISPSIVEQVTGDPTWVTGSVTTQDMLAGNVLVVKENPGTAGRSFYVATATLSALLIMLPVTWVYLAVRKREDYDQALVETMLILPIAVTGIVFIVQNSLALAFSLAGIVAGVRFRHTLKSAADTLYIFIAIGVGLAAGVKALSIALIMTVFFNYTFLALWMLNYGDNIKKGKKYMRPSRDKTGGKKGTAPADIRKAKAAALAQMEQEKND